MRNLARWCERHRRIVLLAWIVVLLVTALAERSTGSDFTAANRLSGTESATAQDLLRRAAPSAAGDSEQIVVSTPGGSIRAPNVRRDVEAMLARVARLPHVASVASPYGAAQRDQVAARGDVAFATVAFDRDARDISDAQATTFVRTARSVRSPGARVDVLGDVAAATNASSSSSTMIGIVAALIVLLVVFGSVLSAAVPLATTGISLFAALSVVGVLSNAISMAGFTSQLCTLIGLGVGIDYSLFILTRTRAGLLKGMSTEDAVGTAAATSGRAVLFAGLTVCLALCGMLTLGIGVLSGAAIAASLAVLFPMAAAQTLLPAVSGLLGPRILTRRQRAGLAAGRPAPDEASARWLRWARTVGRRPLPLTAAALLVMVVLTVPALSLRLGFADYGTDPTTTTTTTHRAYEQLARGFGPGFSGPLALVAPVTSNAQRAAFARIAAAADRTRGVAAATAPHVLPAGPGHPAVAVAQLYPTGSPQDASTSSLISTLRSRVIPDAASPAAPRVYVGGPTALADDEADQLSAKLGWFVGVVVALSFLLLMAVFRSVLVPLTAAAMNLLSAGAAFGVITAVFQWGWLGSVFGIARTGPIEPLVPVLMFAVLFGLSMDYEVFLVSRIHEEWVKRRDNAAAVNLGQAVTGRTITALATIMVVVFLAFVFGDNRTIKMIGLGMATAIAVDALVVRTVLVPAIMHLLGKANWYLPPLLDRRLPRLDLEEPALPTERELGARA